MNIIVKLFIALILFRCVEINAQCVISSSLDPIRLPQGYVAWINAGAPQLKTECGIGKIAAFIDVTKRNDFFEFYSPLFKTIV